MRRRLLFSALLVLLLTLGACGSEEGVSMGSLQSDIEACANERDRCLDECSSYLTCNQRSNCEAMCRRRYDSCASQ